MVCPMMARTKNVRQSRALTRDAAARSPPVRWSTKANSSAASNSRRAPNPYSGISRIAVLTIAKLLPQMRVITSSSASIRENLMRMKAKRDDAPPLARRRRPSTRSGRAAR
jgi:hypothetical protein